MFFLVPVAEAHNSGNSYSDWTLTEGGAQVRARVSQLDLTRLGLHPEQTSDYAREAGDVLARQLRLYEGAQRCVPEGIEARAGTDGWIHARWTCRCREAGDGAGATAPDGRGDGEQAIRSALLFGVAPGHLHFVRARLPSGELRERVLTAREPELALPSAATPTLPRYVALGFTHILEGWDHLAFVLALLLLAASLREMVIVATGFTVAHSVTLAAAVLGLAQPQAAAVEALIGFSIALAALETLWLRGGLARWMPALLIALLLVAAVRLPPLLIAGVGLFTACYFALLPRLARPARLRLAMALLFGLVHGFGFAGALAELELPPAMLATGLLGFNVGVELGQLLVIALAWPLLRALVRKPQWHGWAVEGIAASICAVGVYAFLVRSFG